VCWKRFVVDADSDALAAIDSERQLIVSDIYGRVAPPHGLLI